MDASAEPESSDIVLCPSSRHTLATTPNDRAVSSVLEAFTNQAMALVKAQAVLQDQQRLSQQEIVSLLGKRAIVNEQQLGAEAVLRTPAHTEELIANIRRILELGLQNALTETQEWVHSQTQLCVARLAADPLHELGRQNEAGVLEKMAAFQDKFDARLNRVTDGFQTQIQALVDQHTQRLVQSELRADECSAELKRSLGADVQRQIESTFNRKSEIGYHRRLELRIQRSLAEAEERIVARAEARIANLELAKTQQSGQIVALRPTLEREHRCALGRVHERVESLNGKFARSQAVQIQSALRQVELRLQTVERSQRDALKDMKESELQRYQPALERPYAQVEAQLRDSEAKRTELRLENGPSLQSWLAETEARIQKLENAQIEAEANANETKLQERFQVMVAIQSRKVVNEVSRAREAHHSVNADVQSALSETQTRLDMAEQTQHKALQAVAESEASAEAQAKTQIEVEAKRKRDEGQQMDHIQS
ncbi:hypothetical protein FI667_g7044, partial [Globisporangium splendens]